MLIKQENLMFKTKKTYIFGNSIWVYNKTSNTVFANVFLNCERTTTITGSKIFLTLALI